MKKIVKQLMAPGKGILASDESIKTASKRLRAIGIKSNPETRKNYRELFFGTAGINQYLSGIILHDETIRSNIVFPKNIIPGIKVDEGTTPDLSSSSELVTTGLRGLDARLREYSQLGAKFTKWRAVIKIKNNKLPTNKNIKKQAVTLAKYALASQKAGLVPIVEPEVLMEGDHSIERAEEVTTNVLTAVFAELKKQKVDLSSLILKTSMVIPGSKTKKSNPDEIAKITIRTLKTAVPSKVGGIVFLSGGQEPMDATKNMNAVAKLGPHTWPISFSFARALQQPPLKIWCGENKNIKKAQRKFLELLQLNSVATRGKL